MVMRISGINSGLDIDSMVKKLMSAERMPQDKLKQKQQILTWKQDAFRSINSLVASLRDAANNMRFAANLQNTSATSTDPTKVAITSNASATPGTHTIDVIQLATAGTQSSTGGISTVGLTGNSIASFTANSGNTQLNVTLNGVQKTVTMNLTAGTYTQADMRTALQTAIDQAFGTGQVTVTDNSASGKGLSLTPMGANPPQLVISNVGTGTTVTDLGFANVTSYKININEALNSTNNIAKLGGAITSGTQTLTVNGQAISYSDTDTMQSIINKVNSSSAGVLMSYDSVSDKISFITKNTGQTASVSITDSGSLLSKLKLGAATAGTDAQIKLDGLTTTQSSNNFTVNGVTYNLLNPTTSTISVTVAQDTSSLKKTITDFVDKYNSLISTLSAKFSETKYRDFSPLTDEQKADMKDSDITAWTQKAQSGILRGDSTLKKAYSDLRNAVSATVTGLAGQYSSLADIGITTGAYNSSDPASAGKLIINQSKLDTALATDPQSIINLFSNFGTPGGTDQGVAQKLTSIADTFMTDLKDKAGRIGGSYLDVTSTLGKQEYDLNKKISDLEKKLASKEDFYYQMFTKMDTAIGNSNSTLSWMQSAMK